ncbi:MAG: HPr family phosphocarrier protein [Lachnospiraceae bacterium]
MVSQKFVVMEPTGLHLRPAGLICDESIKYQSKILLVKGNHIANAKSVLGVLAARVQQGDEIEIQCEGPDEEQALLALTQLVQSGFKQECNEK